VSNRIIAAAYKNHWEVVLGEWVSEAQRGFIPGRSMMANVADLEHEAMMTSLSKPRGLLLLVDFKAAFPSVSQEFMQECLEGFGMPLEALRVLESLYDGGCCEVVLGSGRWDGFSMGSGIRQGCPLSPLIFALVMDLLLRVLSTRLGQDFLIRAFADDVGIVLADAPKQLPILVKALQEFGELSGMRVNLPKTVGIPLWHASLAEASVEIAEFAPEWAGLPLRRAAKYLGCTIGPDKAAQEWNPALQKFKERVQGWNWSELGLFFATVAYNTYALSVMAFTSQVSFPTEQVLEVERWALRRAAPGPGNWAVPIDLWSLKIHYGMPSAFRSLSSTARLAQERMFFLENSSNGGLRLAERHAELSSAMAQTSQWSRLYAWADWYEQAIATRLISNHTYILERGIVSQTLVRNLDPVDLRLSKDEEIAALRQELKESVSSGLERHVLPHPHNRVRQKLERWKLSGPPRVVADRFLCRISKLGALVPPRVVAAVFSTAWNRWCTARRFQKRDRACNNCCLGCGGGAEDSIEHYSRCKAVRDFHNSVLNIQAEWLLPFWLGVHSSQGYDEELLACGAIGAFAVYMVTNKARHGGFLSTAEAKQALHQAAKEAVLGHRKAVKILSTRWVRSAG